jgi:transglutaminase-like putative cysteine protease
VNASAAEAVLALSHEADAPTARAPTRRHPAARPSPRLGLRLAAFGAVAVFVSLRYATFVVHPPALRVIALVAIAACLGAALSLSSALPQVLAGAGSRPHPPGRLALRTLRAALALAALLLGLLAIGIPAHLLAPAGWSSLLEDARHGLDGLGGRTWPYLGEDQWVRLTVLTALPLVLVASACICFWPSKSSRSGAASLGGRGLTALGLLVAILVARAANESHSAWGAQGLLLVLGIAAWLWLPTLRPADVNRAVCWLLGCSVIALLVARALGAPQPWIDFRTASPAVSGASGPLTPATTSHLARATTFQWDQLYGPIASQRSPTMMFLISESRPSLLRATSLDRFNGVRFLRSDAPPGSRQLDLPAGGESRWYRHATITIAGLRSALLVSPGGTPVGLRWLSAGSPHTDSESDGSTVLGTIPTTGARYEVSSYLPTPTATALRQAPHTYPREYLPYAQFELPSARASGLVQPNLRAEERAKPVQGELVGSLSPGRAPASEPAIARRIEHSPYAPMFALARQLEAGASSDYDVAERIEHFLRGNYGYTENVPKERYPLEAFLFALHRGYCQQSSGAMALMLRMDGIPARVGAGFRPGVYDPATHSWQVLALDAHAWVEVFFSGIGWVAFDPTPTRPLPSAVQADELIAKTALLAPTPGAAGSEAHPLAPAASRAQHRREGNRTQLLIGVFALGALLLLTTGGWWLIARRRLRRALADDGSLAAAELRRALTRLRYTIAPATTLAQLQTELEREHGAAGARYLTSLRELRYARRRSRRGGGHERRLRRQRSELRRALAHGGGPLAAVRALLALPPGAARRF